MTADMTLHGRVRLTAAGLVVALVAGSGGCGEGLAPSEGPDGETPAAIISNPVTGIAPGAKALSAVRASSVAYVSLSPGTYPTGVSATISNRRTGDAVNVSLIAGGLDPVPLAAQVGDTVTFAIDTGGVQPVRFDQLVPMVMRPRVVRTGPSPRKRDVSLNVRILVVFSEPVEPATVTTLTLRLQRAGTSVGGEVAVSANGLEATFQPAAPLLPETEYSVVVEDGIRDTEGNGLASPVTVGFTTVTLPTEPPPALPPLGALAFTDGAGDLYVMNADGSDRRRLTSDAAPFVLDVYSAWSPDGSRIAFSRYDGYWAAEIYVINADGTNQARLSAQGAHDAHPTWSPDGSRIAFENRKDSVSNGEIYVMNTDGTNRVRLTDDHQPDAYPAWSPDGNRIAYSSTGPSGNLDLYVMNANGTNRVNLTNDPGDDTVPAWSPDGTRIAFAKYAEIVMVNADGTNLVQLTNSRYADQPSWSPDGQVIAFTQYPPCEDLAPISYDPSCLQPVKILMLRLPDRHLFELPQPGVSAFYPSWRP